MPPVRAGHPYFPIPPKIRARMHEEQVQEISEAEEKFEKKLKRLKRKALAEYGEAYSPLIGAWERKQRLRFRRAAANWMRKHTIFTYEKWKAGGFEPKKKETWPALAYMWLRVYLKPKDPLEQALQSVLPRPLKEFRLSVREVGLARTILKKVEWYEELLEASGVEYTPTLVKGGYFLAGLVASVESYIRPDLPTVSGALFQTAVSPATGGFTTKPLEKLGEEKPHYLAGTVIGDILLAKYVFGPIAREAWSGAKWVGRKIPGIKHIPELKYKLPGALQKRLWYEESATRQVTGQISWTGRIPQETAEAGITLWQTIETTLPVKPPPEQWLITMRGTPTTPFSRTLELALTKGRPLGGLAATQELLVSKYADMDVGSHIFTGFPTHFLTPSVPGWMKTAGAMGLSSILRGLPVAEVKPKVGVISKPKQPTLSDVLIGSIPISLPVEKEILAPIVSPVVVSRTVLKTVQVAKLVLDVPLSPAPGLQILETSPPPLLPRRERRRRRKRKRRKGKKVKYDQYEILYPVATSSEAARFILGKSKRKR